MFNYFTIGAIPRPRRQIQHPISLFSVDLLFLQWIWNAIVIVKYEVFHINSL